LKQAKPKGQEKIAHHTRHPEASDSTKLRGGRPANSGMTQAWESFSLQDFSQAYSGTRLLKAHVMSYIKTCLSKYAEKALVRKFQKGFLSKF
jgi:hypothetical protein